MPKSKDWTPPPPRCWEPPPPPKIPGPVVALEFLHHNTQASITIRTPYMRSAKQSLALMGLTDRDVMLVGAHR